MNKYFHQVISITLLSCFVSTPTAGQQVEITTDFPIYSHESIPVRVSGVPDRDQNSTQRFWLTLVGSSARVGTWKQWFWVDDGGGNFEFQSLPAGTYELRLHDHFSDRTNSWDTVHARLSFEVIFKAPGVTTVDFLMPNPAPIYTPIEARINGLEPKLKYWVTIVPQGTLDGRWEKWQDVYDTRSQSIRFDGYEPGNYELRVHDYRTGFEILAREPFSVSWDVGPESDVPSCPTTYNGSPEIQVCRCDAEPSGGIWGTTVYTTGSSICLAAIHSGAIRRPAGPGQFATVVVQRQPGRDDYTGSLRNGVQSESYGRWGASFVVSNAISSGVQEAAQSGNTDNTTSATAAPQNIDQNLLTSLRNIEKAVENSTTAVEIGVVVRDVFELSSNISDVESAVELLEFFEEGSLSIPAREKLLEARGDLARNVSGLLAEYLIRSMIDTHLSGTRGEKDFWKSYASILIGGLSGGLTGYTLAAVVESTSTYLELSSEARAFMTNEVQRAFRIAERIDALEPDDSDILWVRSQMEAVNESAQHAQDVSSSWPQYNLTAVVLRSLGPILETKMQQRLDLAPSSRSDVSNAYQAFAMAHLECELLTSGQTNTLVLILDQFAEDIGIKAWTSTQFPIGLVPSYDSC